ncbi:MAG: hypothetical protein AAF478_13235 [Pseudomonadota bacterium]
MISWQDVTSRRQGEKDRTPRAWATKIGGLKVVITKNHIYNPGYWSLNCEPWFDAKNLDLPEWVEHEDAQREALMCVKSKIKAISEQLETIQ